MCPLLEVDQLSVKLGDIEAVCGVSFDVASKETVALVGESGCGKTVTSLAILRLLENATVQGSVRFAGREILSLDEETMCRYRGGSIAAMFQDPMTSLNPTMTVGDQIAEAVILHQKKGPNEAKDIALKLLQDVEISEPELRLEQYPYQLSGGMRQRVMLAIALSCQPQLLIADEPTTSLDVTTQEQILQLLKRLKKRYGMSLLLITHDFGVVSGIADRVLVMRDGVIVEEGTPESIYHKPVESYTASLVKAEEWEIFPSQKKGEAHLACTGLSKRYPTKKGAVTAVRDVSLEVIRGETLALVGESGSGKSTLARQLMQLEQQSCGEVLLNGAPLTTLAPKQIQVVFQNPYATLDPRQTVYEILKEPFLIHQLPCSEDSIETLLDCVGLDRSFMTRRPHAMSGGQRQRVGIARALAVEPELLILDEPLSALDLATQHQILNLLRRIKSQRELTYLFISHDLSVVKAIADRVAVMYMGQIVELSPAAEFFKGPSHPYSKILLQSVPYKDPRLERERPHPSAEALVCCKTNVSRV